MSPMCDYRFGEFELTLRSRELSAGGSKVEIGYRHFEALRVLLEAGGSVVDRDTLHKQVWPDVEVDETSLNKCISELRKALSDHGRSAEEYIETVRRRGYRLAVPVESVHPRPPAASAAAEPRRNAGARRAWAAALLLAVLAAGGGIVWRTYSHRRQVAALRADAARLSAAGDYPAASRSLRQAIDLAPKKGAIYGELAHVVHKMKLPGVDDPAAIELAQKGVDLDPDCVDCRATFGFFLFYHGWEWKRAEIQFREASRLAPDTPMQPYPFLLAATGRTKEAVEHALRAATAHPLQAGRHAALAQVLYVDHRYEDAIKAADRAISLDRGRSDTWEYRSRAQFRLGLIEEGVRSMIARRYEDHAKEVGAAVDRGGGEAGLRMLLEVTGTWPERSTISWRRAAWFALLGENDQALDAIEEALKQRNVNLMLVAVDPIYEHLHADPRFQAVLREMGLAEYSISRK